MNLGAQLPKTMSLPIMNSSKKTGDGVGSDQFPAGLRVLVVDDDPTCLMILEKMLRTCLYEVTKSNRAEKALSLLRENRNGYDIIISDVHMPDMDGFKLLEHVGLEMDLPVIMMSADDSKSVVMKGVTHGACDYLIKPVRMEALKNIWQHVVRRKKHEWKEIEQSKSIEENERQQQNNNNSKANEEGGYSSSANEGSWRNSKRRKEEDDDVDEREDTSALKKPRVVWSVELHQQFMVAVDTLGVDKAVPKKILEMMNVPGLTRENVASHLQKYRLYLRRLSGVSHHQAGLGNPFMGPRDASSAFGSLSSINGLDHLQALAASGQIPAQSLANLQAATFSRKSPILDQRNNIFSFENPSRTNNNIINNNNINNNNINSNNKQVNLLHGIPTTMEPQQLANYRGISMQQMNGNINNKNHNNLNISRSSSSSSSPIVQQQSSFSSNGIFTRNEIVSNVRVSSYNPIAQPSSMVDFSSRQNNNEKGLLQNEASSGYDVFNDLAQNKTTDRWGLHNIGTSFDTQNNSSILNVQPSVLVQHGFSRSGNGSTQNNNMFFGENSSRVKSESNTQNAVFSDQYGQEDLLSALLKQQEGIGQISNDFGFDGFPPLDNLPA